MTPPPASRLSLWLPVAAFLGVILLLSSQPGDRLPQPTPDLLAHFVEYCVLGLLVLRALNGGMRPRPRPSVFILAVLLCSGWAVVDEIHQRYVPGRFPSLADVGADVAGTVAACGLFAPLRRLAGRWESGGGGERRGPAHLVFLTRSGCHLCQEARRVLDRVLPGYHVRLEIVDVERSRELADRYGSELPVLLINGAEAAKLRLDEARLRRRLQPWWTGVPDSRGPSAV